MLSNWTDGLESPLDCKIKPIKGNQLKEINSEFSLEPLMLKLKLQYFSHLMWRADSVEKTLMLGKTEGRRRRGSRGWDGWMASLTQWTWVWASSGRWRRTGKPGVLQSMGSQRIRITKGTLQLASGSPKHHNRKTSYSFRPSLLFWFHATYCADLRRGNSQVSLFFFQKKIKDLRNSRRFMGVWPKYKTFCSWEWVVKPIFLCRLKVFKTNELSVSCGIKQMKHTISA